MIDIFAVAMSVDKHDDQPGLDIFPPDHDHLDCSNNVRAAADIYWYTSLLTRATVQTRINESE